MSRFIRNSIWILSALLLSVPLSAFVMVHWYQNKYQTLPYFGGVDIDAKGISLQHTTDDFQFENQDGKIFSSKTLQNKITVANFFFTSCKSVCPNMMVHVKNVQEAFINDPSVGIVSFTVDPNKDSAARLKWYCTQYHINNLNWNLLTGDKRKIYLLARKSFFLSVGDGDGGDDDFIHSDQLILIDKSKHIRGYYDGTDDKAVQQLIQDIKKLQDEK